MFAAHVTREDWGHVMHGQQHARPHARPRTVAAALVAPVVLTVIAGPLAGAAVADPPRTVTSSFAVEPGSFLDFPLPPPEVRGQITRLRFTERSEDSGGPYPGTSVTSWTCMLREGAAEFRCTGDSVYTGTYEGVTAPADVRLTATCSESTSTPPVVSCTGRFRLDGNGALEGLHGQGTWQSSGVFGVSVGGSSEMRLHDHR